MHKEVSNVHLELPKGGHMFTPNIPLAHHFSSLDAKHQAEFSVASLKDNNWKDQIQAEGSTASQNLTPARKLGQWHAAIDVLEARILSCTGHVAAGGPNKA